jgi:4-hydroxybenzoate polyprenyltransferase
VAVSALAALLAVADGLGASRVVLVTAAVMAGQLSIGWSNDLVDQDRDSAVGRSDKPLATGAVSRRSVRNAAGAALVAAVVLSILCGWRSAVTHVFLLVGSGWAYNLRLKRTVWSWLPYAVAFGSLPSVVSLAATEPERAPWWMAAVGALLGVGAHVVNALPDLAEDARTGVRGLPHLLGYGRAQVVATTILTAASVIAVVAQPGLPLPVSVVGLATVLGLAVVSLRGQGKAPFRAAIGIALVDVVMLVLGS